jgi:hypothetical protein
MTVMLPGCHRKGGTVIYTDGCESMKKQAKQASTRPDVATARQPESSYIAQTRKPNLQDRERWCIEAYERGVSLEDIVRGSGYPVTTIYRLCGLDMGTDRKRYDDLVRMRNDLITKGR